MREIDRKDDPSTSIWMILARVATSSLFMPSLYALFCLASSSFFNMQRVDSVVAYNVS
jgi:hypothetical protein